MAGRVWTAAAVATVLALGGCARTELLVHPTTSSAPSSAPSSSRSAPVSTGPASARYVAQLRAEERSLATAERSIPTNAPTPGALAHSAVLLEGAVSRLARGLASITPPASVVAAHVRLVAVVRAYARRLGEAAALAERPGGQVGAGALLISATNRASAEFEATLAKIYSTLRVSQP
jgi:hypothetical protein